MAIPYKNPFEGTAQLLRGLAVQARSPQQRLMEARLKEIQNQQIRANILTDFLANADLTKMKASDIYTRVGTIMGDDRVVDKFVAARFAEEQQMLEQQAAKQDKQAFQNTLRGINLGFITEPSQAAEATMGFGGEINTATEAATLVPKKQKTEFNVSLFNSLQDMVNDDERTPEEAETIFEGVTKIRLPFRKGNVVRDLLAKNPELFFKFQAQFQKTVKPFRDLEEQVTTMEAAYQTAKTDDPNVRFATDDALLQTYMKIIDPNSVVREGEFARLRDGSSLKDKAKAMLQKLTIGGQVTLDQLTAVRNLALQMVEAKRQIINLRLEEDIRNPAKKLFKVGEDTANLFAPTQELRQDLQGAVEEITGSSFLPKIQNNSHTAASKALDSIGRRRR